MPNRIIRDGILESEAVLSLPVEARWLYVTILLSADDIGLFEATAFKLARRADIRREHAEKLVQLLVDTDLIRLYESGGKWFGFIPRFRQRIQIKRTKHPLPPKALMADDSDAINKINDLASIPADGQHLRSICATPAQQRPTAAQPPEPEPEAKEIHLSPDTPPPNVARARETPGEGRVGPDLPGGMAVTSSTAVCIALRKAGIHGVNPSHQTLLVLVDAGATVEEFLQHVPRALEAQDPFRYLLGAVSGERRRAKALAESVATGAMPPLRQAFPPISRHEPAAERTPPRWRVLRARQAVRTLGNAADPESREIVARYGDGEQPTEGVEHAVPAALGR